MSLALVRMRQADGRAGRRPPPRPQGGETAWLFDLDNTLHDTSHAIFPRIDALMLEAVMDMTGAGRAEADRLRTLYWRRYGATMIGLARHHGVDAHEFLRRSHDFDPHPLMRAERGLARRLARLPGRKILLTNAPLLYALAVLKALRLLPLFDSFWGVEEMRLHGEHRPKPSVSMLRHILWREGLSARRTVLVEDTLDNLKAARRLGLRTVHIHHPGTPFAPAMSGRPHYVDRRLRRVGGLLVPSACPGGGDAT